MNFIERNALGVGMGIGIGFAVLVGGIGLLIGKGKKDDEKRHLYVPLRLDAPRFMTIVGDSSNFERFAFKVNERDYYDDIILHEFTPVAVSAGEGRETPELVLRTDSPPEEMEEQTVRIESYTMEARSRTWPQLENVIQFIRNKSITHIELIPQPGQSSSDPDMRNNLWFKIIPYRERTVVRVDGTIRNSFILNPRPPGKTPPR